jgi:3-hydroxymyristoyl/3-hydroxydecanoyl-(acyl carrier protein) dehydratase
MTIDDLQQQFPTSEWPKFLDVHISETTYTLTLQLSAGIKWFEGHFPQQPILAGVVQTHWAAEIGKRVFAIEGDLARIDNLKFQSVIHPEQVLQLVLNHSPESNALKFSYRSNALNFSEGKFIFQSALSEKVAE